MTKKAKQFPVPPEQRTQPYWALLNNVIDPELGVGIVDLGLIYDVDIKDGCVEITMTFTSMGCPVGPSIIAQVEEVAEEIPDVEKVSINLVWEPAWTADRMNPDVRAMLAI
ncbi:MAG: hypothetical protein G01um101413_70 [Parcubacteria group bacterium Gr01-1014_13]|nr:MAG: hypothetical protein G01um101413_70 [Parcubacteria group bacterium Gr01-1014_13]